MKIVHLADLHLGKTLNNYSLMEDQKYLLNQILEKFTLKQVDAVFLSGDIYDKPVPSAEAVTIFDQFLSRLQADGIKVFVIAGNHDGGERLSFASNLLNSLDIHIVGTWNGTLQRFDLSDKYGPFHVYCLPYIRPSYINRYIDQDQDKVHTVSEAIQYALQTVTLDSNERNVILAHQFVNGATLDGSEELIAGGLEAIPYTLFNDFDYAALGHIHHAQYVGTPFVRYAGSLMHYVFEENAQESTFTVVNLENKGEVRISTVPLKPLHPMEVIKGTFVQLLQPETVEEYKDAYLKIILTDEDEVVDGAKILKQNYPYLMRLEYDQRSKGDLDRILKANLMEEKVKSPKTLFEEFYEQRTGDSLRDDQQRYLDEVIQKVFTSKEAL